jgi:hypothetical protein
VDLLVQTAGALAAAGLIATFIGRTPLRSGLGVGLAAAVAGLALVVAVPSMRTTGKTFLDQRRAAAAVDRHTADHAGGAALSFDAEAVDWYKSNLGPGQTFYLLPPPDLGVQHWISYRLIPNVRAPSADKADWILRYATPLAKSSYDHSQFPKWLELKPGFGMARRHAG